jgi:Mn2+/Fe2+ NRAMP family transporter
MFEAANSEERSMRAQVQAKENTRYIAAFIAGAIFYLAGTICVVMAFNPRQAVPLFLGAMFFFFGSIWVVIGAKYKKEAGQS